MYKTILVPIDLAEPSSWEKSLPVAVELGRPGSGRIHIATVVRDVDAIRRSQYSLTTYESMIAEAETRLAGIVADTVPGGLRVTSEVGRGSIYAEILRIAAEIGADLIVMASHRPQMKDYLIGPNAAKVVRHAVCSVLVVRDA